MATNVKILLRRGLRSEISADTLSTGEMGFANDTNQLYVGIDSAIDEVVFDPFANAHAIIQSYLNLPVASNGPTEQGLEIDEDLIIKNVSNVTTLLSDMSTSGTFNVHEFGRARRNVEVLTENSFSQVYANMHLQSHTSTDGRRPDLFKKELTTTSGTFLKYAKTDSTSFFIDYSLKQTDTTNTFIRVGTIRVINGAIHEIKNTANTHYLTKLTDDNTEIWQDTLGSVVGTAEAEEFSNIEFTTDLTDGVNIKINYTQDASFSTEISYTVKRWTM